MSPVIKNRYDFVFLFDVKDGNPNGDPDQDNLPRVDPENQNGLVTDVCIKRKIRNYVELKHENKAPYDIFIRQGKALNSAIEEAEGEEIKDRQKNICSSYYDVRTFGAVLSTGKKPAGTVRGPVQFTFARSLDRVYSADISITRCAVTTEEELEKQKNREHASTMGRKAMIPYGLYEMHGFISATDAAKTGFSEDDLELLWDAILNAFEHDRAAARGEMNPRKLVVFKHSSHMGNARSGELFKRLHVEKKADTSIPRAFSDYTVTVDKSGLPTGVELIEKL